ncbi:MAG: hypothetical protein PHO37_02370 [Kiritimatiellae bacterium]|nr:hypothetical protein [Kiritimatiellia bacterium]
MQNKIEAQAELDVPIVYAVARIPKSGSTSLADGLIRALNPTHVFKINPSIADAELYKNPTTRYITGSPDHPAPFDRLPENCFCFGTLDDTKHFCVDFEQKTGIKVDFPHLNPSPSKFQTTLSGRNLSLFKELYATDLELYDKLNEHVRH